ncbi:MAG: tetraacyldisaccharide 4'-kinase [Betaproteobacteria bacterium]|nr:tetraacyldisaccharide 4'-kinase [Betaproteobacteria bacterium]
MARLHAWLPGVWLQRSAAAWLLRPLSWLYGTLLALRRLAYRRGWRTSQHPGIPVIVVGNVVAGGAGKTPTTIALVQHLQARGIAVGVVSRGHGRAGADICAVQAARTPAEVGDEPLLIWQRTGAPVWVGRSRVQAAAALRRAHPEVRVLVCDDGLQHLALQRDLEICVMDERGPGNGWLLPAGPLREPWPRTVDLLLYTDGVARPGAHLAHRQLAREAHNGHGQRQALAALHDTPVDAVAGLARPEAFFAMLRQSGLHLADTWPLPDHDDFARWQPTRSGRPLLCTEKDAVKLWVHQPEAWAVPLQLQPAPGFWLAIDAWLRQRGLLA